MKRAAFCILCVALVCGTVRWSQARDDAGKPTEKKAGDSSPGHEAKAVTINRDTNGNAVVNMPSTVQQLAGIAVTNVAPGEWNIELRGYGRVLDPTPLAALVNELSVDQAAYAASSLEYERLNVLSRQSNASARALENARSAAAHDQLAIQSVRDRLTLTWGAAIAGQSILTEFVQELITRSRALARVDLPAGQTVNELPGQARIVTLSGAASDAKILGTAPATDPQLQGQGFILTIETNAQSLAFGQALSGYLKIPGKPVAGVIIPREAVVRTEGAAWVYVVNAGRESFTRVLIPLDRPTEKGWFVPSGILPQDSVVAAGAQTLLSEELKGALSPD